MSLLVVVLDARTDAASLDATAAEDLARLGVTHVAIARDDTTEAVVLEGWAFDAARTGAQAAEIVAGSARSARLHEVLHTVLGTQTREGDSAEPPPSPVIEI